MENAEAFILASKKVGLEVNAGKTKHVVMSRDQQVGPSPSMKTDNRSLKGWKSSNIWEQI